MNDDKKVWLITGCSSGFGRHIAEHLLERGRQVVVTARNLKAVADLGEHPGALLVQLDVTSAGQCDAAIRQVKERFGRLDVLVNNAGIGYFAAVEETPAEQAHRLFDVNYFGTSNMIRATLPLMREQRSGVIANLTSIGGLCGFPAVGHYCASKFAVEGLSDTLRAELSPLGIHVMTIEPSAFRTEWAGASNETPSPIADYDPTAGAARRAYHESVGKQAGDPARAAKVIADAVESASPPRFLLLGKDAHDAAMKKVEDMRSEFLRWKQSAIDADFPA
ncbi:MAG: oxidoreductase [Aquincola tertiaricarbonis]|uniref:oxidoreductase n=1 Tax=Aquincola TaxID=391952 RepID=UPI000614E4DC|nr:MULTISPECIES: oxidoreductase [Aquincola]MCR5868522.1 SDR family NAD(P)-dependent oxidoreductase [Aquincola sp. J276]